MSGVVVLKFGGAALGSHARVRAAARRVAAWRAASWNPVVVVSACGRTTDRILRWVAGATTGPGAGDSSPAHGVEVGREVDRALATGEDLATALLAAALLARGVPAAGLAAGEAGVVGAGAPSAGRIVRIDRHRLNERLASGVTPVVSGFHARTESGETISLGRGGTDISAVVIAAAMGARDCHLIKDVPGVYDRDPNIHAHARLLPSLTPHELTLLASGGDGVLHPEAALVAERLQVPLRVYGFDAPTFGHHGSTISPASAPAGLSIGDGGLAPAGASRREEESHV